MLTKAGAKLLDFGLAKLRAPAGAVDASMPTQSAGLTGEGKILGTLQYMAPEQVEGQEADARTDIFAFGALVYEMITGERAFKGNSTASLIAAILYVQTDPMSTIQPTTPSALDRVVTKCLAKDPDDRWYSAHDLTDELRWIAREREQTAGLANAGDHVRTSRETVTRSRSCLLPWVGAVAIVLVAGLWVTNRPEPAFENPLVNAQFTPLTDFEGVENDADISPDGRFVTFRSDRDGQFDLFVTQVGSGRFTNLTNGSMNVMLGTVRSIGFSSDGPRSGSWASRASPGCN